METCNHDDAENNRDEVKASTLPPLKPGDTCYLIKDEQDGHTVIPAGSRLELIRPNGFSLWYCRGQENNLPYTYLVFTSNLSREPLAELKV